MEIKDIDWTVVIRTLFLLVFLVLFLASIIAGVSWLLVTLLS